MLCFAVSASFLPCVGWEQRGDLVQMSPRGGSGDLVGSLAAVPHPLTPLPAPAELVGLCDCGGLLPPGCHQPPAPPAPPRLQDHGRLLTCFSLPLPPDTKAPPILMGTRSPGTPLKDTQTLNLPPRRRSFGCRHCARAYASLGALKMHIRTHTLPCLCPLCGKAFSRPWLLRGHIRTHTGKDGTPGSRWLRWHLCFLGMMGANLPSVRVLHRLRSRSDLPGVGRAGDRGAGAGWGAGCTLRPVGHPTAGPTVILPTGRAPMSFGDSWEALGGSGGDMGKDDESSTGGDRAWGFGGTLGVGVP